MFESGKVPATIESRTPDAAVSTIDGWGRDEFVNPRQQRDPRGLSKVATLLEVVHESGYVLDGQHRVAGLLAIIEEAAAEAWSWAQASALTIERTARAYLEFAQGALQAPGSRTASRHRSALRSASQFSVRRLVISYR